MNNNKNLFWYGLRARIKEFFGVCFLFFGLVASFIALFVNGVIAVLIFVVVVGIGFYLILTAKAQRFDYKMQSGTIIHRGDF